MELVDDAMLRRGGIIIIIFAAAAAAVAVVNYFRLALLPHQIRSIKV
jgi:hypothetical protein